jgi:hypothetical protein
MSNLHLFWKEWVKFMKYFMGGAAYKFWEPLLFSLETGIVIK